MKEYLISEKLLQAIVNVLQELPAKSVIHLLNEILQLKPLENQPVAEEK